MENTAKSMNQPEYQSSLSPEIEDKGYVVRMIGISKSFPGTKALKSVNFDLKRGEVHVLVGENGAGKSTLIKVLSGVYQPDAGEIYINERKLTIKNPHTARSEGVYTAYQELSLVPQMTVLENFFLGAELQRGLMLDKQRMRKLAQSAIDTVGLPIDLDSYIAQISPAHRQMVEIARHFIQKIRVLILDEPTSALTSEEVRKLFGVIKNLKEDGVGIIYISHRLDEVKQVGDRASILRDGENVATIGIEKATEDYLIELMTGRKVETIFPTVASKPGNVLLEVEELSTEEGLKNVCFQLHAGEILGFGGLIGSGKENIGRGLFGLEKITTGSIKLGGKLLHKIDPSHMTKEGIVYIPSDRHTEGLLSLMTVRENITTPSLGVFERYRVLQKGYERHRAEELTHRLDVRTPSIETIVAKLSGGNQQKVVVARSLVKDTKVFIFHELTRGIDIGTKIEIYKFVQELAKQGAGIIYISSELAELLNLTHRVIVTRDSRIADVFDTPNINEEILLRSYFGWKVEEKMSN
jgi:ribose transport system ATP-binding protein